MEAVFEISNDEVKVDFEMPENDVNAEVSVENVVMEGSEGTGDYNKLKNLPSLNGKVIKGNVEEIDPTVPDWAKQEKKPSYNTDEIGAIGTDDEMTLEEIISMMNSVFN